MWHFINNALTGRRFLQRHPPVSERLVYAIGDIHGRADLLEALVEKILNDALIHQNRNGAEHPAEVVFIGDVIDRGPNTSAVLEFMTAIAEWPEIEPIFILGNHEEMLLSFLKDPVRGKRWMRYGGYETLLSYNLALSGDVFEEDMLIRIAGELKQAMAVHLALLETFVPVHRNGNLYFVHAGANPAVSMDAQQQQDLVWGNDAFLRTPRRDGNWVIHGHTVVEKPSVKGGRIAIDTGAYLTGALTAVKVSASEISFLTETGARGLDGP